MSKILILMFIFLIGSCGTDDNIKPSGNSQAIPIYNQAYSENFDADNIDDIIREARNAYVLIDPFEPGIAEKIAEIKANNNQVGGYISIGTGEDWRSDFAAMQPFLVSTQWAEWEGEFFIKEVTTGIIPIMKARIDQLAEWGCDWVEFDNMDWFFYDDAISEYGITVTESEGIAYYQELCTYAHSRGLKCMAKNHVVEADSFDGVLYESYHNEKDWWDHAGAQSFLDAGKLVIINHYNEPQPNSVYAEYIGLYNDGISFICESSIEGKYIHFNQ
ncbi:MAG: endo alpha-1,4 polygalactosaminidase [Desulfobacterales bacterium]|nr:endo alpha-1,4 polygalactosaminidase [Desulfobacterales bacterium]